MPSDFLVIVIPNFYKTTNVMEKHESQLDKDIQKYNPVERIRQTSQ